MTKSAEARERVRARLQKALDHQFPELVAGLFSLELGPPIGWPVQYRVSGKDPNKARHFAQKVAEIMATAPDLQNINFNWGDPARKLKIDILQEEARRLGLSSASIAQAIYTTLSGFTATQIRDSIYLIDVVLRAQKNERVSIEDLRTLSLPLPNGKSVPLSAVATLNYVQDYPAHLAAGSFGDLDGSGKRAGRRSSRDDRQAIAGEDRCSEQLACRAAIRSKSAEQSRKAPSPRLPLWR